MNSQTITIPGPAGNLEAQHDRPDDWHGASALLCHPHPQFGGSMHDGVLGSLAKVLLGAGYQVIRFNFRGVGASQGQFDQGAGEADDVAAMLQGLARDTRLKPDTASAPPLLAGYSFGAAMAWQAALARQAEHPPALQALWLVAPPLSVMPFPNNHQPLPLQLLVGDGDSYCDLAQAQQWLDQQLISNRSAKTSEQTLQVVPGADHFFGGQQHLLEACAAALL